MERDPLAQGLNAFQLMARVDQGSRALNSFDYLMLGGETSTALAKADMMANGVPLFRTRSKNRPCPASV